MPPGLDWIPQKDSAHGPTTCKTLGYWWPLRISIDDSTKFCLLSSENISSPLPALRASGSHISLHAVLAV